MEQNIEPTVDSMNESIALFDGWRKLGRGYGHLYKKDARVYLLADFKYHTSWDWLIPCWNKLRSELYQCMPASGFNDGFDKYGDAWKTACFNAEIQNAHKVVYSAIKWLNQQKQKDGEG